MTMVVCLMTHVYLFQFMKRRFGYISNASKESLALLLQGVNKEVGSLYSFIDLFALLRGRERDGLGAASERRWATAVAGMSRPPEAVALTV